MAVRPEFASFPASKHKPTNRGRGNPRIKSEDGHDGLPRHAQAALCRLVCVPLANSATISRLKTRISCGPRLVHRAREMVSEYMRPDPSRPEN